MAQPEHAAKEHGVDQLIQLKADFPVIMNGFAFAEDRIFILASNHASNGKSIHLTDRTLLAHSPGGDFRRPECWA
jgi:hypothetical protein